MYYMFNYEVVPFRSKELQEDPVETEKISLRKLQTIIQELGREEGSI